MENIGKHRENIGKHRENMGKHVENDHGASKIIERGLGHEMIKILIFFIFLIL